MINQNTLFILVGASCAGKTYWTKRALKHYPKLQIVKSNTTRPIRPPPDEADDRLIYNFLTQKEFDLKLRNGEFFQQATARGYHYSLAEKDFTDVLDKTDGVIALLAPDAENIADKYGIKYRTSIILLRPSLEMLIANARRRGMYDADSVRKILQEDNALLERVWRLNPIRFRPDGTGEDEKLLELFEPNRQ